MVRVRSVVAVLLIVAACPLFGASKKRAATRPPSPLQRVGDHYTPYNPPDVSTFPADAKVHIIKKGDTLWDLAKTYYGNAYLWPQLWEQNTYITDAHWIYPGDPLLVQGEATTGAVETTTGTSTETEETVATTEIAEVGRTIPLGTEADVFCYGYLGPDNEPLPNRIASFQDSEMKIMKDAITQDIGVADGEIIYVRGGAETGLVPGETYMVVGEGNLVKHPATGELLGRQYDYRGRVRILCLGAEVATAVVVQSCTDLHIGDALKPMPQLPIPLARITSMTGICDPPNTKPGGYIVRAQDYQFSLGEGNLVQINLGRDDALQPGDFLTVWRPNAVPGYPRLVLGEIGVLTTEAGSATAKIVQMTTAMTVGDQVEVK